MAFCGALLRALYSILPSIIRQHLPGGGHYSREGFIIHWLLETRALFEIGYYSREGSNRASTVHVYSVALAH